MSEKGEYLTVKEASKVLGVTPVTLRRWDNAGKLKAQRHPMNHDRMYDPVAVAALNKAIVEGKAE